MIKFFRHIRKDLIEKNKIGKYFKYAIGEIILVVIGILIALSINNWNENKKKTKLGHQYLMEMKSELQDDVFKLDSYIMQLKMAIKNQEAALNTKNISKLPIDSLVMIVSPINLDIKVNELTYNKMSNLGITSLSNNDSLNSNILKYYNTDVVQLKSSMAYIFNDLVKYSDFQIYELDKIDITAAHFSNREFPSLYKQSKEESAKELKSNLIEFIYSIKGRKLIIYDLEGKRYSLGVLNRIKEKTVNLFNAIYDELKINNPEIKPLPTLPSEIEYKEIEVSKEKLKTYTGTYVSKEKDTVNIILENEQLYLSDNSRKNKVFPYEEDKFFVKDHPAEFQFIKAKGNIIGFTLKSNGEYDFKKLD